jgi:hypothetical protein
LLDPPSEQSGTWVIAQQLFEVVLIFEHARPMPGHARAVDKLEFKRFIAGAGVVTE